MTMANVKGPHRFRDVNPSSLETENSQKPRSIQGIVTAWLASVTLAGVLILSEYVILSAILGV